jgi:hypothetical protein
VRHIVDDCATVVQVMLVSSEGVRVQSLLCRCAIVIPCEWLRLNNQWAAWVRHAYMNIYILLVCNDYEESIVTYT